MAVERSARSGSAIGDVYMLGAIGSIAGTFVAGFYLIYAATTTTIVILVAAGLAFLCRLHSWGGTVIPLWRSPRRPCLDSAAV